MHKALLIAVAQVSALASDCFGDQEALPCMLVIEGSRVELNIAEVLYFRTHIISHGYAVAGSDRGVGGELIDSADAACCKNGKVAVICCEPAVLQHEERKARACFLCIADNCIFEYRHIIELLDACEQSTLYLRTC